MGKIQAIMINEGVTIQPYWRTVTRHHNENLTGVDMHMDRGIRNESEADDGDGDADGRRDGDTWLAARRHRPRWGGPEAARQERKLSRCKLGFGN